MKNSLKTFVAAMLLLQCMIANAQVYEWAAGIGSTGGDNGVNIATDDSGYVYITGYFSDVADFDPGPGVANLTAVGGGITDIFFAKYDADGNYIWAKRMGDIYGDTGNDIAIDDSGNVYLTGHFKGTVDFDPGPGTANLTNSTWVVFFAKYDSNGNYKWAKNLSASSEAYGLALDGSGNFYITGYFETYCDFDPGTGSAAVNSAGGYDIYVAKYNCNGNYLWMARFGSTGSDIGNNLAVDADGNVYITGHFSGTADFDPGSGTTNLTAAGSFDVYIAKYTSNGNYVWAGRIGSNVITDPYGIAIDNFNNLYVSGYYFSTTDFDPGPGTANLTAAGNTDVFIAKFDTAGNYIWAKSVGGTDQDEGYGLAVDLSGNIYITGNFKGTADFDPGTDTANLTANGTGVWDAYYAKYDSDGNYIYSFRIGGTTDDKGKNVATDINGNVYVIGSFQNTADFDPGTGVVNYTALGYYDIYFAKYSDEPVQNGYIGGTVSYSGGLFPAGAVQVGLLDADIPGFHTVQTTGTTTNGDFIFLNPPTGDYFLKVKLFNPGQYPNVINTYYDSTYKWNQATILSYTFGDTTNIAFKMFERTPFSPGNGKITGKITFHSLNKDINGEPVPGAEVTLEQEPDDDPISSTSTDGVGQFEFLALPPDTYSLYVDIPGIPLISTYTITLTGNDSVGDIDFYVDTLTNLGIYSDTVLGVYNIKSESFSLKMYPNPFSTDLTVEYTLNNNNTVTIDLYDNNGKIVYTLLSGQQNKGEHLISFNTLKNKLESGIYYVKVTVGSEVYLKKLVKRN